jgi:hypothetical protein
VTAPTLEQPILSPSPAPKAAAARPWPKEAVIVAWLLIAAGALFRIRWYFHWRSLWLDELFLAHSILHRGFGQLLFKPLDYWQAAPVGFLALERLCVDLLGHGEKALRLPSLLGGLASLPLFYYLTRRLMSLRGTLLALVMFASISPLVHYSAELKPYSTDVAVGLAIMLCGVAAWERSARKLLILTVVGAAGLMFSFPAAFVLGGTAVAVIARRWTDAKKDGRSAAAAAGAVIPCIVVWGAVEWCNVHFFLHTLVYGPVHQGLVRDWMTLGGFPPWLPNRAAHWVWVAFHNIMASWEAMYLGAPDLGMFMAVIGGLALLLGRKRAVGLLIVTPLMLAVVGAFRRQYPLADRLALYLVPLLTMLVAEGIDQVWGNNDWRRSMAGGLAAIMLISSPIAQSGYEFRWPSGREETKQVYQWLQRQWRPGDLLVLSHMAEQSYNFYGQQTGMAGLEELWLSPPDDAKAREHPLEASAQAGASGGASGYVIFLSDHADNPALYLEDIDGILHPDPAWHWPPIKRLWIVFDHVADQTPRFDQLALPELDRHAQQGMRHEEDGASVYFYDLTGAPTADARPE